MKSKKPIDLIEVRQARENLDRLAHEHPEIIDLAQARWDEKEISLMILDPTKTTFTVDEVAEALDVQPVTIRRAIQAGKLKAAKLGRVWRISRVDLEEYYRAAGGGDLFPNEAE